MIVVSGLYSPVRRKNREMLRSRIRGDASAFPRGGLQKGPYPMDQGGGGERGHGHSSCLWEFFQVNRTESEGRGDADTYPKKESCGARGKTKRLWRRGGEGLSCRGESWFIFRD